MGAVRALGGYAGGVYLRSGTEGLLRMAAVTGLPGPLFRPWWRIQVNRPYPVAEAFRSGQAVHLPDGESAVRRFPQLMAGLPFPFGSLYEPVGSGPERFGVLLVIRAAAPGGAVGAGDGRRIREAAEELGRELAELAAGGDPVCWEGDPLGVPWPVPGGGPGEAVDRLAQGVLSVDRQGVIGFAGAAAARLLGLPVERLLGRGLWEALPWLRHPAYEDHLRGAFLSGEPLFFDARREAGADPAGLSVGLYPGPSGVTVVLEAAERPVFAPGAGARPGAWAGAPAGRAPAQYRPVALAIALTEAMTARQVSAVVTEELLPAFGGR
ncbi:diguanylate cyclase, partial [Streptomyces katrae]